MIRRELLLVALLPLGLGWGCPTEPGPPDAVAKVAEEVAHAPIPPVAQRKGTLVVVGEDRPWLAALAAPVVSLRTPAWLVAQPDPGFQPGMVDEVRGLAPKRCLILTAKPAKRLQERLAPFPVEALVVGDDPVTASLTLAKAVWPKTPRAFLAPSGQPASLIQAAALAARHACPVLVGDLSRAEAVHDYLKGAGVRELVVVRNPKESVPWIELLADKVRALDGGGAQKELIAALGHEHVHAVALARIPEEVGRAAWLAPYYSLARSAPVVLVAGETPKAPALAGDVEKTVRALLLIHRLRPRSLAILAEELAIEGSWVEVVVPDPKKLNQDEFRLPVEPLSTLPERSAAALGVGRIPFSSLADASRMLLRSVARERLLRGRAPAALMVANPNPEHGALPLAETVSRLTALELRNRRIKVQDFYGIPSDAAPIRSATRAAQLIVFEGHLGDQRMFEDPEFFLEGEPIDDGQPPAPPPARRGPSGWGPLDRLLPPQTKPKPVKPATPWRLDGQAVLILQSCNSLSEEVTRRVHGLGGAAVLGSVTKIHSASGSTFIHALVHGLLERGHTLGEALRDARNYFLLLQDLKDLRGHKEQAKSLRVALSFRLWGDPELRVFSRRTKPRLPRAKLTWTRPDTLSLTLPARRLKRVSTTKYFARVFPGSELAGMVKRRKKGGARRILPIHFRRLPVPKGFRKRKFTKLQAAGLTSPRCVFRLSEDGRALYVLYLAHKEKPRARSNLVFSR